MIEEGREAGGGGKGGVCGFLLRSLLVHYSEPKLVFEFLFSPVSFFLSSFLCDPGAVCKTFITDSYTRVFYIISTAWID